MLISTQVFHYFIFKGEIEQALVKEIPKLEIVAFQSIENPLPDLPDEIVKGLSRDQHLLYLYTKAIATGRLIPNVPLF